jgi:hypothetical protein
MLVPLLIIHREWLGKTTNKVLKTLFTKLVGESKTNWDEHLPIVLFSYETTYKVAIGYTPYQLVYGLHLLMPTKYILLIISSRRKFNEGLNQ